MESEIHNYIANRAKFAHPSGVIEISKMMAEITIFTASRSLQGKQIRDNSIHTLQPSTMILTTTSSPLTLSCRGPRFRKIVSVLFRRRR